MSSSQAGADASSSAPKPACRGPCSGWPPRQVGGFFQATCGNAARWRCALTCTARKKASSSDAAPERPLEFTSCWLKNSFCGVKARTLVGRGALWSPAVWSGGSAFRIEEIAWRDSAPGLCARTGRRRAGGASLLGWARVVGAEPETSKAEGTTRSAKKKHHAGSFVSSFFTVHGASVRCKNSFFFCIF